MKLYVCVGPQFHACILYFERKKKKKKKKIKYTDTFFIYVDVLHTIDQFYDHKVFMVVVHIFFRSV